MSIFRKFPNKKVRVCFNLKKAREVTLLGREQIETYNALKNGHVYKATAYHDQFGRIVWIKLKDFPKVSLSARMFDFT